MWPIPRSQPSAVLVPRAPVLGGPGSGPKGSRLRARPVVSQLDSACLRAFEVALPPPRLSRRLRTTQRHRQAETVEVLPRQGGAPLGPPRRPGPGAPPACPPGGGPTGTPAPSARRRGAATRGRPRGASAGSCPGPAKPSRPGGPALSVPSQAQAKGRQHLRQVPQPVRPAAQPRKHERTRRGREHPPKPNAVHRGATVIGIQERKKRESGQTSSRTTAHASRARRTVVDHVRCSVPPWGRWAPIWWSMTWWHAPPLKRLHARLEPAASS